MGGHWRKSVITDVEKGSPGEKHGVEKPKSFVKNGKLSKNLTGTKKGARGENLKNTRDHRPQGGFPYEILEGGGGKLGRAAGFFSFFHRYRVS